MKTNRSIGFIVGFAILLGGCSHPTPQLENYISEMPFSSTTLETRPIVNLDAGKPYTLELGRGSGLDGFDTISVDHSGETVLYRQIHEKRWGTWSKKWETAQLSMGKEAAQRLVKLVLDLHLLEMNRSYSAGAYDGTQWIFRLTQEGKLKSIYCDNYFPKPLRAFSRSLDTELKQAGVEKLKWRTVSDHERGLHDKDLWSSIKDKPNKPSEATR